MSAKSIQFQAVLFDLDGTLADTAPDMVAALNRLCLASGAPTVAYEEARAHVSHGSRALVKLGFPGAQAEEIEELAIRYLDSYAEQICAATTLYEGMHAVLASIEQSGRPWGIVTNKPERFTTPLVAALNLSERAACIVSGDTVSKSKPHALPLLHACEIMQTPASACVYIGDAERDIVAGRAAGMHTLAALYGYILSHEDPRTWRADGMIEHPDELMQWLQLSADSDDHDTKLAR